MFWSRKKKKTQFQEFVEKTLLCNDLLGHFNKMVNRELHDKTSAMLSAKQFTRDTNGYITIHHHSGECTVLMKTEWFSDCSVTGSEFRSYRKLKTPPTESKVETKVVGFTEHPSNEKIVTVQSGDLGFKRPPEPIKKPTNASKYEEYRALKWLAFMYNHGDYVEVKCGQPILRLYDGLIGHTGDFSIPFRPKFDHNFYVNRGEVDPKISGIPFEKEEMILDTVISALSVMRHQYAKLHLGITLPTDRETWWAKGSNPMVMFQHDSITLSNGSNLCEDVTIQVHCNPITCGVLRMTSDELQSIALEVMCHLIDQITLYKDKIDISEKTQFYKEGLKSAYEKLERTRRFYEFVERKRPRKVVLSGDDTVLR